METDWVEVCALIADRSNERFTDVIRWPIPAIQVYLKKLPKIAKEE